MTSDLRRGRVAVVGSVNTDYVLRVSRRPRPGETVADAELEIHPGGKGANQAVAAVRSGAEVVLVARVGEDDMGRIRINELQTQRVSTEHVLTAHGIPSGLAFITVTPDGENAITVAPGANAALTPTDIDLAAEAIRHAAVLVCQLEVPVETVSRAAETASSHSVVVLNCAPWRRLPDGIFDYVDVLVANEVEAGALLGSEPLQERRHALVAAARIQELGPRTVVITLGSHGAVAASPQGTLEIPAPPANVVDTTGAGDAFVGGLSARLALGDPLAGALEFAVRFGTATTEHPGAVPGLSSGDRAPSGHPMQSAR